MKAIRGTGIERVKLDYEDKNLLLAHPNKVAFTYWLL